MESISQEVIWNIATGIFVVGILAGNFFLERLRRNLKRLAPDYYEKIDGNRRFLKLGDPLYSRIQFSIPDDFPQDFILVSDAQRVIWTNRILFGTIFGVIASRVFISY